MKKLYEGKAKILYQTENEEILLTHFKDDATAFNAQKKGQIKGKGEINCSITSALYQWLEKQGIPTHFISKISINEMTVKSLRIIPLEVVVRNIASGSLCKQTGIPEGTVFSKPLIEFYLKDDNLGDPLLTPDRIHLLKLISQEQLEELIVTTRRINRHLQDFFLSCAITLVDFKLEYGLDQFDNILLADEISPDTCRLWDQMEKDPNGKILDKDRFRKDLGNVEAAYQEVQKRVLLRATKL
jgi:phosphoribosylaminoimidazole-succinocarboxamide synthase